MLLGFFLWLLTASSLCLKLCLVLNVKQRFSRCNAEQYCFENIGMKQVFLTGMISKFLIFFLLFFPAETIHRIWIHRIWSSRKISQRVSLSPQLSFGKMFHFLDTFAHLYSWLFLKWTRAGCFFYIPSMSLPIFAVWAPSWDVSSPSFPITLSHSHPASRQTAGGHWKQGGFLYHHSYDRY